MRIHMGEKPFELQVYLKYFIQEGDLTNHMQKYTCKHTIYCKTVISFSYSYEVDSRVSLKLLSHFLLYNFNVIYVYAQAEENICNDNRIIIS